MRVWTDIFFRGLSHMQTEQKSAPNGHGVCSSLCGSGLRGSGLRGRGLRGRGLQSAEADPAVAALAYLDVGELGDRHDHTSAFVVQKGKHATRGDGVCDGGEHLLGRLRTVEDELACGMQHTDFDFHVSSTARSSTSSRDATAARGRGRRRGGDVRAQRNDAGQRGRVAGAALALHSSDVRVCQVIDLPETFRMPPGNCGPAG